MPKPADAYITRSDRDRNRGQRAESRVKPVTSGRAGSKRAWAGLLGVTARAPLRRRRDGPPVGMAWSACLICHVPTTCSNGCRQCPVQLALASIRDRGHHTSEATPTRARHTSFAERRGSRRRRGQMNIRRPVPRPPDHCRSGGGRCRGARKRSWADVAAPTQLGASHRP